MSGPRSLDRDIVVRTEQAAADLGLAVEELSAAVERLRPRLGEKDEVAP